MGEADFVVIFWEGTARRAPAKLRLGEILAALRMTKRTVSQKQSASVILNEVKDLSEPESECIENNAARPAL